ncbi:peptide synthetase [Pseudonocardiaceae bacterium YIM PH 21723]|nr:peptide synthetase [Pseudonocardiaceae bacterium YIM PH 21723]
MFDAVSRWSNRQPQVPAVIAADGSLTFAELSARIDRIARNLAADGIGVGSAVAIARGRSREGLAALLALWRLGATAILVDEKHPADRLDFVLRDSGAEYLIADRLPEGVAPGGLLRPDLDRRPEPGVVRCVPDADGCAYIVYTSGTTGRPKGVEISYRNLRCFLDALSTLGLPPGGVGVNAVSPGFDGWLWCALLYLMYGQTMVIVEELTELADLRPRTVCLTPSLLAACLDAVDGAEVVVVAGEPCPATLLDRLRSVDRVLNVYGPTEVTIAATWADSARGDEVHTIGHPAPGYRAYVLDEHRQPVIAGCLAELYLGGPAVAMGYRNQPELTARRFLPDPFGPPGSRMYRTGDLVIARPDGQLEFLGRVDDQVKVRGYRVELTEVDQVACAHPCVRTAAAFVSASGDVLGLAVVPEPGRAEALTEDGVRAHCADRLPSAAVPAFVDLVAALPVQRTGKIDRDALAAVPRARIVAGTAPRTDHEREVCRVWSELLPEPVTDVQADFFTVGGHSLLAARAVTELRRSTGLRLSLAHLMAEPTVAAVAAELDRLLVQAPVSR